MKTIQEAVESTIRKTPFIEEALNEKIINVSSLARVILPEVDKLLKKQVKVGAVMMAINRLSPASELRIRKNIRKFTLSLGDFIVRSDLSDYTYKNTKSLLKESARILTIAADKIQVWGYNSSLGGKWSELRIVDRTHGGNTAQFPKVLIPDAIAKDTTYKIVIPVEGVERIAVRVETIPARDRGSLDVYLGVNSI